MPMCRSFAFCLLCLAPVLSACSDAKTAKPANPANPANPAGGGPLSGTIYWDSSGLAEIHKLDLASGKDVVLGPTKGNGPTKASNGKIIFETIDLVESDEALIAPRVIIAFDTTEEKALHAFHDPQLSREEDRIAYESQDHNCYVVARADGRILARFEPNGRSNGCERPSWTRDGRIVVAGGFANQGLYVSDAALTTLTRFDPDVPYPRWPSVSPDGLHVAFVSNKHVFTIGIDGTGLARLDTDDASSDVFPSWSPDGAFVAYVGGDFAPHLMIRPAGGGAAIDVHSQFADLPAFGTTHQFDWSRP